MYRQNIYGIQHLVTTFIIYDSVCDVNRLCHKNEKYIQFAREYKKS